MKVILAGYNVDADVLEDLKKASHPREDVTPETLSASYARISRDSRPIDELRKIARQEVAKARKSNSAIIFKMGHHSIAEHAVFNFDILGVSRLALEEIEKFRLCAYTEKSQRYQKLDDDYIIPDELRGTKDERRFRETIKRQNQIYRELIAGGIEPEDARYVTSLAIAGQVGQTINARNLEFLFRRFASNPLAEVRQLGQAMYKLAKAIAPSIILFAAANDFDQKTHREIKKAVEGIRGQKREKMAKKADGKEVSLEDHTKGVDDILIAALMHGSSNLSFKDCLQKAKKTSIKKKTELIKACFQYAEFYDCPLREFEYVDLTYNLVVSAACFGQLKRHRMATITCQPYDPALGVTIPESIKKAGLDKKFNRVVDITNKAYQKIARKNPLAAQYILTNAHRRRVLINVNARELYHISRLREDKHAQWDIQNISTDMAALAKKVMPLTMLFIGGKDRYPEIYESQFGRKPKVLPED